MVHLRPNPQLTDAANWVTLKSAHSISILIILESVMGIYYYY